MARRPGVAAVASIGEMRPKRERAPVARAGGKERVIAHVKKVSKYTSAEQYLVSKVGRRHRASGRQTLPAGAACFVGRHEMRL